MITVKKIQAKELPEGLAFVLEWFYHTEPDRFTVIFDDKGGVMYVNPHVPQKDIEGFMEVAEFPGHCVADREAGKGKFLEHACKIYGCGVHNILIDAHKEYMKREGKRRAKESAKAVIPLIEKELKSGHPDVEYDEFLIGEIWKQGYSLGKNTQNNVANYGSVYLFYLGYLMGAGLLEGILADKGMEARKKEG